MQVSQKRRCRARPALDTQVVRLSSHFRRVDLARAVRPIAWDARNARTLGPSVRARRRDISSMMVHLLMAATAMFLFWDLYLLAVHAPG